MTRQEFPVTVKREALARSGGRCEGVGIRYGYTPGERCKRIVHARRVNYEHYPRGAHDPHPETRTLSNCTAICPECNQYANNKFDTRREQSIKNVSYDEQLHRAKMQRKAGVDVPDPPKPRGRQGKHKPIPRPKNFKWAKRPMTQRKA